MRQCRKTWSNHICIR